MVTLGLIFSWLFSLLFAVIGFSMILTKNFLNSALLILAILFLLPPLQTLIKNQFGSPLHPLIRIVAVVFCFGGFLFLMSQSKSSSIFFTPEFEAEMSALYDQKLEEWPLGTESRYLDTSYGKVYVLISGPEDAPPALLLNAGQMAAWSWVDNVEAFNQTYRTYAIGTIGEVGRSQLRDINHYPTNGEDLADLYIEIMDILEINKADIIGASNGGFIAANIAIFYPQRVGKMALLGPMGLTPSTNENIVRIALSQLFPLKIIQDSTISWAFGEDPALLEKVSDWFCMVMNGSSPKQVPPRTMSAAELQQIHAPVLLVLGKNDNLMGDLQNVRELASNVENIQIVEIEAGHLMGMEAPEICNSLVMEFMKK